MANWDLPGLERDLPKLKAKLLLIAGGRDRMIAPAQALEAAALVPGADVITLKTLGHLCHEEDAPQIAAIIERASAAAGIDGAETDQRRRSRKSGLRNRPHLSRGSTGQPAGNRTPNRTFAMQAHPFRRFP